MRVKSSTRTGALLHDTLEGLNRKGVKTKSDRKIRISGKNKLKRGKNRKSSKG